MKVENLNRTSDSGRGGGSLLKCNKSCTRAKLSNMVPNSQSIDLIACLYSMLQEAALLLSRSLKNACIQFQKKYYQKEKVWLPATGLKIM